MSDESVNIVGMGAARLAALAGGPVTVDHPELGRIIAQPHEAGVLDALVLHAPVGDDVRDITDDVVAWATEQAALRIAARIALVHNDDMLEAA